MKKYKKDFIEVDADNCIASYTYKGHQINVDENYQGSYDIFIDGENIACFSVENFETAGKVPMRVIDEYINDEECGHDDISINEVWVHGYLDDELNNQMWEEFHKTVEMYVKKYI